MEALWHIIISILRPLWEWQSTFVTIVAFILQDIARIIVIVCSLRVIWGVRKFTAPHTQESSNAYEIKKRIQFLWRTLFSLILLGNTTLFFFSLIILFISQ